MSVVHRAVQAIFEREGKSFDDDLFNSGPDGVVGRLDMDIGKAKIFKSEARIAFVVAPKIPYLLISSFPLGKTTIDNPVDMTVDTQILIGDIRCALLLEGNGGVVLSIPTR